LLQERQRKLYQEGAVSREQVDDAETAYQVATSQRDSAQERLDLVLAGARPEEIDIARAGVEQAQAGLERARASERQVDVLRHNLDSAEAALTQALAAHRQALEDLNNTTIRSPIAGTVYDRDVKVGRTAAPGTDPLLRIAAMDGMYFEPTASEMDIASITSGSPDKQVSVEVDALPGERFEGRIVKVTPQASAGGRDFTLKVSLAKSARRLRPGLSARGQITVRQHGGAVIIPKDALVNRAGKPVVFVVDGQVARQRSVEVGIQNRMEVEILSGVRAGESVVTAGHNVLADNDRVQVR
jgi:RND family efflux transporter MFP subunit